MGKKKLSLKPVQRGFATTSIPTKKTKAISEASATESPECIDRKDPSSSAAPTTNHSGCSSASRTDETRQKSSAQETWDNDEAVSTAATQAVLERLQEKGEKEVARILKSIELDKRLSVSFPRLGVNATVQSKALQLARENIASQGISALESAATVADNDKILLRLFVVYNVLCGIGFAEDRVEQCILSGVKAGDGWEEALDWMWLHITAEEAVQVLGKGRQEREEAVDPPLLDVFSRPQPSNPAEGASSDPPTPALCDDVERKPDFFPGRENEPSSLFQSLRDDSPSSSEDESDSDVDLNLSKVNSDWATLKVELEQLKTLVGTPRPKGKKSKTHSASMETPDMFKIRTKMSKLEKDYMFNRKDADALFRVYKAKNDMDRVEAKLRQTSLPNAVASRSEPPSEAATPATPLATEASHTTDQVETEEDSDTDLFGNMLDEPETTPSAAPVRNTTISVRSMPIPKQFTFTGNTPKAYLRSAAGKLPKPPAVSFASLSANTRIARAGLEITWSPERRKVWKMEDLACDSPEEAENYVSTLALHALTVSGEVHCNWRAFPPAYRDLWDELEDTRLKEGLKAKRKIWQKVLELVDQKRIDAADSLKADIPLVGSKGEAIGKPTDIQPKREQCSADIENSYKRRVQTLAYMKMRETRDTLPIAPFREDIIQTLQTSQVLVFSGETGCGKSTQLPSFILENELAHGRPCKIVVTEPRRISAISLAQRVSAELGDAPGTMGTRSSLVGYSIRLESKVSSSTRLTFMTNGIALRMLESASDAGSNTSTAFDDVTHIVVDEVHERSIESDFLLIVLKELLQVRKDLKIVLMSATVDADKISRYFDDCPSMSVPGRTYPVTVNYLEDAVEMCGWHIDESSQYAVWDRNRKPNAKQLQWAEAAVDIGEGDVADELPDQTDPTRLQAVSYSSRTVSTVNLLDSRKIPYDLIVRLLETICFENIDLGRFSAATLVFMPGLAEIRKLNDLLQTHPRFGASGDFVIYPLHSTISSEGQSAVFNVPRRGVRKIVISTNIAETGVTIPDITCVIDTGKQREMRYDEKRQLSKLVETFIARSNAKQRRGRAGRVQEGLAFHLFNKARHDLQLADHPVPEMLRLSLQDLALRIKILKVKLGNSIEEVLGRALDPPSATNIQRAVQSLVEVRALTTSEDITPMGRLLSKLPMEVHLGKILLVAALFKCLDPALTIVATLNSKSPFLTPLGLEDQADAAKRTFAVGNSDFLTLVNVFDSWRRVSDNRNFVKTYCQRNFLSHTNLQQIEELRQQLLVCLIESGFVSVSEEERAAIVKTRYSRGFQTKFAVVPAKLNTNADNTAILGAALVLGLYPKILTMDPSGGLRTLTNQQPVSLHPSSINYRVPKSEFGSSYLVYFTLMQSKKLYAWESGPVEDRALALLCGESPEVKLAASSFQIDRRLRFNMEPRSALALKILRERFLTAITTRMRQKPLTERQEEWFELGLCYITTGEFAEEQTIVAT